MKSIEIIRNELLSITSVDSSDEVSQYLEGTLGRLKIYDNAESNERLLFGCKTLELPYVHNARRHSCIKPGTYKALCNKKKKMIFLEDKHGRTEIAIHSANKVEELLGCIAVGKKISCHRLNNDQGNFSFIDQSKKTMNKILEFFEDGEEISVEVTYE